MESNAMLKKLQLVLSTLDSKVAFFKKRKQKNLLIPQSIRKQQLLLFLAIQENSNRRFLWMLNRHSTFWEVNCNCNGDHFFKMHFRMTQASFDVLCGMLKYLNKMDTKWRSAITLEKRVAIALFTLSSSGEYRVVSELFGVGKSTVCKILLEFCEEVWEALSTQYIKKLPPTQETVKECVEGFRNLGFPQCLGAVDGCHIKIKPNEHDATDYYSYKGWYSVVLLALVDYRYRFLYVNIGVPGRCNDSQIFSSSRLKNILHDSETLKGNMKEISSIQMPVCILGDSAFKFSTTVMKPHPFSIALSNEQKLFYYRLSKCRRVVENAFGHIKAHFRRIGKGIDNRVGNAPQIIRACCVLHNFLNERNDSIKEVWMENLQDSETSRESPSYNVTSGDNEAALATIRQALCSYFSSLADVELGPGDGEHGDRGDDEADNDTAGGVLGDEFDSV